MKTHFSFLITYIFFSLALGAQNLNLTITGKTDFETQVIDSLNYSKKHENYISLKSEVDSIQKKMYSIGYIENELIEIKKTNDSSFVTKLHLKNRFNTIHIYCEENLIDKRQLNLVSKEVFETYFVLRLRNVESALKILNAKISEKGLPFSKLKLSDIEIKDASTLKANLYVNSNQQKRLINNIVIKGYEKFPRSFLKHYLKIKPSQAFNLSAIKNKTEQLKSLRFASEIKSPEVLFSQDSTTLYLYLNKTQSNTFDGFLGFGTNEETNNVEFDGFLNLNLTNNLNYGESFGLLYKSDENDQKTFEANLSLPYLFKSPVGVDLSLRIFKRDSSFTIVNQSAKIHYQIDAKHKIYIGILLTESNNLLTNNASLSILDYKSTFLSMAYQYLKPQNYKPLFPVNSRFYLETNFGNRSQTTLKEKQTLLSFDGFKIFNLNNRNSLFIRLNGSALISNNYYENELLRFGGINSLRGFEENSLTANLYTILNTEYRYKITNNLYIHSVFDTAYFENDITSSKSKLYGYGIGFGLLTKAGLFKLNYANGIIEDNASKMLNYKVHVSLIVNF